MAFSQILFALLLVATAYYGYQSYNSGNLLHAGIAAFVGVVSLYILSMPAEGYTNLFDLTADGGVPTSDYKEDLSYNDQGTIVYGMDPNVDVYASPEQPAMPQPVMTSQPPTEVPVAALQMDESSPVALN
jgi:hypothetical protein